MPSWIRKSERLSEEMGCDDGPQVGALEQEAMGAEFCYGPEVYEAARTMLMDDLRRVGATLRDLQRWFGVDKTWLSRRYQKHPVPPADATTLRYHRRLAQVIADKPQSFHDLVAQMMAKAGTTHQQAQLLFQLGSRAKSADVALGESQKSRAKAAS